MNTLLNITGLCHSYGKQKVLKNIKFQAGNGEYISIIGANGTGKTTLLKLLSGNEKPQCGTLLYNGREIHKIPVPERAREIAVLYQNSKIQFPFTCMELVWMGRYPMSRRFGSEGREAEEQIMEAMELTDCLYLAEKRADEISGGELQKVMLARALAQKPQLLLLDEAMSDLDIAVRSRMSGLLKNLAKKGLTIIAVNHDIASAYLFSDRILALCNGSIAADGPAAEVLTESLLEKIFGIKGEVIPGKGILFYDNI